MRLVEPRLYPWSEVKLGVRGAVLDTCNRWLAQRYPPLAHAEIWRLWPEHDYAPLKRLIAEYFGDGYVLTRKPPTHSPTVDVHSFQHVLGDPE
jgi:hypothetical protein